MSRAGTIRACPRSCLFYTSRCVYETAWYVVDNHDTITMKGGQIINTSGFSSLVRNIGATFNLENGTLQNTFIVLKNDDNGVFNMTGGKVVTTGSQGSALQNWGKATISGGTQLCIRDRSCCAPDRQTRRGRFW